ncbi:MAG: glycosyltransferase family 2 protein [Candidatus Omnitrophota bacterium]
MEFVFWFMVIMVFYTYLGYPAALKFFSLLKPMPPVKKEEFTPAVSIVVPAYNEENAIDAKIRNLLSLNYPVMKLEIVIVSDCSSDHTDAIVESYASKGIRLIRMPGRGGKIAGYKAALPALKGDIVVFSDATSRLELNSLRKLVGNFADPSVGCVAGRLVYRDPRRADIARGELSYWSYESMIKKGEEKVYSLTSVSGTFYAFRKGLFPVNMADDLADDLVVVLNTVKNGQRVVMEPEAVCEENAIHDDMAEINKRWRITVQNLRGLAAMNEIMNPFKYRWYAWMIISHKLFRALFPVFLFLILLTNVFLTARSAFLAAFLLTQIIFYLTGALGCLWQEGRPKAVSMVYYFCVTNLAILMGIIKFLKGERVAVWETAR